MTMVKVIESVDESTRKQADRLHRQLQDAIGSDSVTLRLEGPMIEIFRDVTALMERVAGFAMAALADELTPEQAGKILGISRPLVVRRMDDGRLPFRYEGAHRRSKLVDVIKLKAIEDKQAETLRDLAGMDEVDYQPAPKLENALVDANVLFPHHLRNVLPSNANGPTLCFASNPTSKDSVLATARKMNEALPGAGVTDFAKLEINFPKTDAKDRHVAAAAARCAPSTLVTWNVRDFNKDELAAHDVEISDPDTFLCRLFDADPEVVFAGTQRAFGFLRRPHGYPTWTEYLDLLGHNNHLKKFADRLRSFGFGDDPPEDDSEPNLVP